MKALTITTLKETNDPLRDQQAKKPKPIWQLFSGLYKVI